MMHVSVDYPDEAAEAEVIKTVRDESRQKDAKKAKGMNLPEETIFAARAEIDEITVPDHVLKYMVDFIFVTRYPERIDYELKSYISCGASPRGSLSLDRTARSFAWLKGDKEVSIEHVQGIVKSVLRHRIAITERGEKHNVKTDELIDDILEKLDVPKA